MTIKKGIVVLSGSTETHKFLDDGSAIIGRADDATQTLVFSGSVFVEGLANDLVTETHALKTDADAANASVAAAITVQAASIQTSWDVSDAAASASINSVRSDIDAEVALNVGQRTSLTTSLQGIYDAAVIRATNISSSVSSQAAARAVDYTSLQTRSDAVNTQVTDMAIGSSNLFSNGTYTKSVEGMVGYILSISGTTDGALTAANNSLSQLIDDEEAAAIAGDGQLSTQLSTAASIREVQFGTDSNTGLSSSIEQERGFGDANQSLLNSVRASHKVVLDDAIAAGDASLQTLLSSSVDGTGELSARASADASIQTSIGSANTNKTADFTSLQDRLSLQTVKRVADVSTLNSLMASKIATNTSEQSTVTSLINKENTDETSDFNDATSSLSSRLVSEKADEDSAYANLSANISSESSTRVVRDTELTSMITAEVSSFDSSMLSLQVRTGTQISDRQAKESSLQARISSENSSITEMVSGSIPSNLSALVSFIDSVDAASDQAVGDAINSLSTTLAGETSTRTTKDASVQTLIDAEETSRIAAVGVKDTAFAAMEADHLVRTGSMKAATDTMIQQVTDNYLTPITNTATATLSSEAGTRASEDTALSQRVTDEAAARAIAITALQTARAGDASGGDTSLQNRINAFATTLNAGQLTLTNALSGAANVTVDGTMQVGRLTVAEATANGYLSASADHKGKLFYLNAPVPTSGTPGEYVATAGFRAVFPEPQKWYFYEDDTWHPMPFYNDTDGDGHRDQLDHFPNDASEWLDFDGDLTGSNADWDDTDPGPAPTGQVTFKHVKADNYGGDTTVTIHSVDSSGNFTSVQSYTGTNGGIGTVVDLGTFDFSGGTEYAITVADAYSDGNGADPTIVFQEVATGDRFGRDSNGALNTDTAASGLLASGIGFGSYGAAPTSAPGISSDSDYQMIFVREQGGKIQTSITTAGSGKPNGFSDIN